MTATVVPPRVWRPNQSNGTPRAFPDPAYFESKPVDYEDRSNWGSCAYQTGVGNDSRDNNFYVPRRAERHDENAEYVTHQIPGLGPLPPEHAHHPWQMSEAE